MSSVIDRANKLIALSGSSYDAEATQAAVQAAKLMREHGLVAAAPPPAAPTRRIEDDRAVATAWVRSWEHVYAGRHGQCVQCRRRYEPRSVVHRLRGTTTSVCTTRCMADLLVTIIEASK
jgi:hypothetical protein